MLKACRLRLTLKNVMGGTLGKDSALVDEVISSRTARELPLLGGILQPLLSLSQGSLFRSNS